MVKVSYQQKPYRRALMETYGARVVASPSTQTQAGRKILAQNPNKEEPRTYNSLQLSQKLERDRNVKLSPDRLRRVLKKRG